MAYDERLAERIRRVFEERRDIAERNMFGGLAFLCRGRMCCGIVGTDLMVRVADEFDAVMRGRHVRPMDFTGRPLRGFVYVSPPGSRVTIRNVGKAPGFAPRWLLTFAMRRALTADLRRLRRAVEDSR